METMKPLVMATAQGGAEIMEDKSTCLVAGHEHPILCCQNTGRGWWPSTNHGATLRTPSGGDATKDNLVVSGVDCRNFAETGETYPTLQAKDNGGQSLNYSGAVRTRYIVRRLTPTECARLQGFPDCWGRIDHYDGFTEDQYQFWLGVRQTHDQINGRTKKDYTKDQILKWYNKLHTDSAEYKMWGNGIALPNALFVMEGIAECLEEQYGAEQCL